MKPTHKLYYPLDTTPTIEPKDSEWWIAQDIQKEILKRKNQYVSLSKIGRIAKQNNLVKDTTYGFKLYHKDLVDLIIDEI